MAQAPASLTTWAPCARRAARGRRARPPDRPPRPCGRPEGRRRARRGPHQGGVERHRGLRAGLPHVGPDVLSQRLRDLEQSGIVRRGTLPPPAGSRIYELTERGRELEPVVIALGRFGSVAPFPPGEAEIGVDAVVIALKSLFAPAAADGRASSYELRLGEQRFRLDVADGRIDIARGSAPAPDATIETDPGTLASVLWHGRKLDEARRAGDLALEGDRRAVTRFVALFPLPTS